MGRGGCFVRLINRNRTGTVRDGGERGWFPSPRGGGARSEVTGSREVVREEI